MGERPLNHMELLAIANKDEQYQRDWIEDDLQEILQQCLGTRRWIQYRNAISVLSRFGYFALTTLSNKPTPGESFCNAEPVATGTFTRIMMIILNNELRLPSEIPMYYAKLIKDVHLVTYFLFNDFYELCKRVTNYSYTTSDMATSSERSSILSRILGCLVMVKMAINIANQPEGTQSKRDQGDISLNEKTLENNSQTTRDPRMLCHLCSESRKEPTSTICGHIFCWHCIHLWLRERGECPICRTQTEPSRLISLINFK